MERGCVVMSFNIAIDGPAGAGKSTIAKRVAKELSFIYVDTGAMYRGMAYYFLQQEITEKDSERFSEACKDVDIAIQYLDGEQVVILNGENINAFIRTEAVGNMASVVATNADVRKKLVQLQQRMAAKENVIMDGRDIGTCVLPNADLKIYLTASSYVRAKRRYEELKSKGQECDLEQIEKDIIDRDYRDMNREISPLKQAEDAVLLDTSDMTIDEVVDKIIVMYQNCL